MSSNFIYWTSKYFTYGRFRVELVDDDNVEVIVTRNAIVSNEAVLAGARRAVKYPKPHRLKLKWSPVFVFDDWSVIDHTYVRAMMKGLDQKMDQRVAG